VTWKGRVPFDLKEVSAQPDGFLLTFTEPVDPVTAADPASYSVAGFTYKHHSVYGSSVINRMACPVMKVVVAPDRLSVRLGSACLREGYIHEVKVKGVRSAAAKAGVLHDTAYYTLNRFPDGERILPANLSPELCAAPVPAAAAAETPKHTTVYPKSWPNYEEDATLVVGTVPGLKYDNTLLTVKAGAHVRLVFKNNDDMLHNLVIVNPGRGDAIGQAALALGLDGLASNYVPDSADVLHHTALLQPGGTEAIFFIAPDKPGDYEFLCTFPGHFQLMRGILRVTAK
jgi:azurin